MFEAKIPNTELGFLFVASGFTAEEARTRAEVAIKPEFHGEIIVQQEDEWQQAFNERVRFNWGYHDAAFDYGRGKPRATVETGRQTVEQVSREFDPFYYLGYVRGLSDNAAGAYAGNSDPAWLAFLAEQSGRVQ